MNKKARGGKGKNESRISAKDKARDKLDVTQKSFTTLLLRRAQMSEVRRQPFGPS